MGYYGIYGSLCFSEGFASDGGRRDAHHGIKTPPVCELSADTARRRRYAAIGSMPHVCLCASQTRPPKPDNRACTTDHSPHSRARSCEQVVHDKWAWQTNQKSHHARVAVPVSRMHVHDHSARSPFSALLALASKPQAALWARTPMPRPPRLAPSRQLSDPKPPQLSRLHRPSIVVRASPSAALAAACPDVSLSVAKSASGGWCWLHMRQGLGTGRRPARQLCPAVAA